jgi:para-nitrobenzyl esterase
VPRCPQGRDQGGETAISRASIGATNFSRTRRTIIRTGLTSALSLSALSAFFPNVDGFVIPQQPVLALALGEFNHVPVIEGTNHDEGRLFIALAFDLNPGVGPLTATGYPAAIETIAATAVADSSSLLGSGGSGASSSQIQVTQITQEILNEYPLRNFQNPDLAFAAVFTDSVFSCPTLIANELFSLRVPTFAFELNDENAPMLFLPPVSFPYGATHTDELQFLFSINGGASVLNSNEQKLATTMKGYWTTFAGSGNPNSGRTANWPLFVAVAGDVQSLLPPSPSMELNFATEHHCTFWTQVLLQTAVGSVASALRADGI